MRPVDAGARLDMTFQIVGMQFDQSGDQQIAAAIDRTPWNRIALGDPGDHPALDMDGTAHHTVGQDQFGIGEDHGESS